MALFNRIKTFIKGKQKLQKVISKKPEKVAVQKKKVVKPKRVPLPKPKMKAKLKVKKVVVKKNAVKRKEVFKKKPPAKKKAVRKERVVRPKIQILPPSLKITNKVIEELVTSLAGEDVTPLVMIIKDKKNVSEFKIAEQINLTVNQVRNMLYRLHKYSLVTFTRKKDKKKGWYVYYWTLDMDNLKEALLNFKKEKLAEFKQRLENEQSGVFFVCPNACMRLKYETAMEYDFKCQECGQLMKQQDNSRTVSNIKANIKELEEELGTKEEVKGSEEAKG